MRIYPVIKDALDVIYADLATEHGDDCEDAVWSALGALARKYEQLTNGLEINYGYAAAKYAYLYKYAGSRACAVFSRLNLNRTLGTLFQRQSLRITSLGAGPGSDLLGILKYWEGCGNRPSLQVRLVDRDHTWQTTAQLIQECALRHLNPQPLLTVDFTQGDLSIGARTVLQQANQADLFTVSYLLSELDGEARVNFLNELFSNAHSGAVFLIVDIDTIDLRNLLSNSSSRQDLHSGICTNGLVELMGEDERELGCHFTWFSDFERNGYPNKRLNAVRFLAVKR